MTGVPRPGGTRLVAVAAAVVLLLGGTVISATAHGGGVPYVALGDSYTAGPLVPPQVPHLAGCGRSARNYPHLVAAALGLALRDVSCSGATTADMSAPQAILGGANPPQMEALDAATGVVTLGIGGNDIGFAGIVLACVAPTPLGQPCRDRFAGSGGGEDEFTRRIAEAGPKVAAVLAEIRRRAPSARVYVVGYPAILPDQGLGCWPVMPFAYADVAYLRDKEKELNAMLAAQAGAADVAYVDTYGPSVGRDACALPGIRGVEPVVPISPAAPVHPNAGGMRRTAAVVAAAVDPASVNMEGSRLRPDSAIGLDVEVTLGSG